MKFIFYVVFCPIIIFLLKISKEIFVIENVTLNITALKITSMLNFSQYYYLTTIHFSRSHYEKLIFKILEEFPLKVPNFENRHRMNKIYFLLKPLEYCMFSLNFSRRCWLFSKDLREIYITFTSLTEVEFCINFFGLFFIFSK